MELVKAYIESINSEAKGINELKRMVERTVLEGELSVIEIKKLIAREIMKKKVSSKIKNDNIYAYSDRPKARFLNGGRHNGKTASSIIIDEYMNDPSILRTEYLGRFFVVGSEEDNQ